MRGRWPLNNGLTGGSLSHAPSYVSSAGSHSPYQLVGPLGWPVIWLRVQWGDPPFRGPSCPSLLGDNGSSRTRSSPCWHPGKTKQKQAWEPAWPLPTHLLPSAAHMPSTLGTEAPDWTRMREGGKKGLRACSGVRNGLSKGGTQRLGPKEVLGSTSAGLPEAIPTSQDMSKHRWAQPSSPRSAPGADSPLASPCSRLEEAPRPHAARNPGLYALPSLTTDCSLQWGGAQTDLRGQ